MTAGITGTSSTSHPATQAERARRQGSVIDGSIKTLGCALVFGLALSSGAQAAELNPIVPGNGLDENDRAISAPRFNESGSLAVYRNFSALVLRDRAAGVTQRITLPGTGDPAGTLRSPDIDLQGARISFEFNRGSNSAPPPPGDPRPDGIYLHERSTGESSHISRKPSGSPIVNVSSSRLSGNGQFVVFVSEDDDLVPNDTNAQADVFVIRVSSGQITRISVSSAGVQAEGGSGLPTIDASGTRVSFSSDAANLVAGDTNGESDVFVHDLRTGDTRRVSEGSGGLQANGSSGYSDISDEGNDVAFVTSATNLGGGARAGSRNVYLHALASGSTVLASSLSEPAAGSTGANRVSISADGQTVAFGYSLYPNGTAGTGEDNTSFIYDRTGNRLVNLGGGPYHYGESISPDGSTVGFSDEYNYLTDSGGPPRAYAVDRKPFCDVSDAALQHTLPEKQWQTLSLPCELPTGATLSDLFADDIPGTYQSDWVVFVFDDKEGVPAYRTVALTERLEAGQGYWIYADTGGTLTLDMPVGSRAAASSFFTDPACIVDSGCHDIPLRDSGSFDGGWNLIGTATARSSGVQVSDLRFVTNAGTCAGPGCTYAEASSGSIDLVAPRLWLFDGAAYQRFEAGDTVLPWNGFWTRTNTTATGTGLALRSPAGIR